MFKKFVNILLIVVLSITVLPIKQVGKMLTTGQWTEEINDHPENSLEKKSQPSKWNFITGSEEVDYNGLELVNTSGYLMHFNQTLPPNLSGEIHSPPPNQLP